MTRARFPLLAGTPPLQPMPRLAAALGFEDGALWCKRDDLTGLVGGGNKARKLEYLVGEASDRGCDVLVTAGAAQSNHVRMTGAAAAMAGLGCTAVLGGRAPEHDEGNLVIDRLVGIDCIWVGSYDAHEVERVLAETTLRLAADGHHPYEIPLGGANPTGTLGYVRAADEIAAEAPLGAVVYTATGTGGTQAGLVVGFGHHDRVRGIDVGAIPDVDARIDRLVAATAALAGRALPEGSLDLDIGQVGPGYGRHTDAAREAIELAARHEGILLDPVYSGKAMAGLVSDLRSGRLRPDQPTVFLHTGGAPALFTRRHADWLAAGPR